MKNQVITKTQMNNRANQLNPNNEAYWKSRMGNAYPKSTKKKAHKTVKQPTNQHSQGELVWKVEYKHFGETTSNYFADKLAAIEFVNGIQNDCYCTNIELTKCYL